MSSVFFTWQKTCRRLISLIRLKLISAVGNVEMFAVAEIPLLYIRITLPVNLIFDIELDVPCIFS